MLEAYNLAASLGRRYAFSQSQEQILRGILSGLSEPALTRFENQRRSIHTIRLHRASLWAQLSRLERILAWWVIRRETQRRMAAVRTALLQERTRR